jgi:glycosyltransferase involved in cell wall biosynthesis
MKILINTTPPTNPGGVANHYKGLKKYWTEDVQYNYIGGRKGVPGNLIIIYDILKFILKIIMLNPDVILLNPSLGKTALMRDGLFLSISKILGIKTVVFFHGWDEGQEQQIDQNPDNFVKKFNRADAFLVLASSFQKKLKEWGVTKPIQLTTTKVDDDLVKDFEIGQKELGKNLLYLARIEPGKGIFITLKAFKEINKQHPDARLTVAGSGSALPKAKEYVKEKNITGVEFKGYVTGGELETVFRESSIYILPTHAEGMPTSVLEAMVFGLPIITRPVGGMVDFFKNGEMGYMVESLEPADFADKTIGILDNPQSQKEMGEFNYVYAKKNFMASGVAVQLEELFKGVSTNSYN